MAFFIWLDRRLAGPSAILKADTTNTEKKIAA
jgi:hypothetical protein